jgi:hypothetical protein
MRIQFSTIFAYFIVFILIAFALFGPSVVAFSTTTIPITPTQTTSTKKNYDNNQNNNNNIVVVVGKIIIDEYGDPTNSIQLPPNVSIGGGGPQAAFGAAAALAVWDCYYNNNNRTRNEDPPAQPVLLVAPVGKDWISQDASALRKLLLLTSPSSSNRTSGDNYDNDDNGSKSNNSNNNDRKTTTNMMEYEPILIQSHEYYTPRIRLWHDNKQNIHWYAMNDSFGPNGADGLWRNRPSTNDLISILKRIIRIKEEEEGKYEGKNDRIRNNVILHLIAEAGADAAGGGYDWSPLLLTNNTNQSSSLLNQYISYVGVEPVASAKTMTEWDAISAITILNNNSIVDFFCPDYELDKVIQKYNLYNEQQQSSSRRSNENNDGSSLLTIATRDGPRGSKIRNISSCSVISSRIDDDDGNISTPTTTRDANDDSDDNDDDLILYIPAATLRTDNGKPINPTGAGNAYCAAMTVLLGTRNSSSSSSTSSSSSSSAAAAVTSRKRERRTITLKEAACIATGVGAIVCEYEGLPLQWNWSILDRIYQASLEVESKISK